MISIKTQILEMSVDALQEVIEVIRSRPDIASVLLTTQKEVDEMDEYYRRHWDKIHNIGKEAKDEPA